MRLRSCFTILQALTVCFALNLSADDQPPLLKKFDADMDGVLAADEIPDKLRSRMQRYDGDADGRLSAAELAALPDRAVERLLGETPSSPRTKPKPGRKPGEVYAPAAREELDQQTLDVGDDAPDFTLPLVDGEGEFTLSAFEGEKPVVLVFGSITCQPFRQKVMALPPIYEKFKDRAEFRMVYIREAHPESIVEVSGESGDQVLKKFVQTDDIQSRLENAQYCTQLIKMPFPTVVDGEDNRIKETYCGWPIRLMVVSSDGKIAYDGGLGPKGFVPLKLDSWLSANL